MQHKGEANEKYLMYFMQHEAENKEQVHETEDLGNHNIGKPNKCILFVV